MLCFYPVVFQLVQTYSLSVSWVVLQTYCRHGAEVIISIDRVLLMSLGDALFVRDAVLTHNFSP